MEIDLSDVKQRNPFTKRYFNLTKQGVLHNTNPQLWAELKAAAPAFDAEEHRKEHTRNLYEFNQLEQAQKIQFIRNGGEIV